jgi:hypothetical protein
MSADARLAEVLEWLWRTKPPHAVQDKAREILLDTCGMRHCRSTEGAAAASR